MQKIIALIITVLTATLGFFYFTTQQEPSRLSNNATLTVGMMSGWAPFMTIDNTGKYIGFDVDVAYELGKQLNKSVVIKDFGSLAPLFLALEQGKIDCILSGLDITQERLNKLIMLPYTGQTVTQFSLLFWQKIPTHITSLESLIADKNAVVCAEPGSAQAHYLEQFPSLSQKSIPSVTEMLLELRYAKSLAAFVEPQVAYNLQKREPNLKILPVPLPEKYCVYGMGIALKKTNTTLGTALTQALTNCKKDNTIAQLERTWQLKE